jgi:ornithine carbamoyltransferase
VWSLVLWYSLGLLVAQALQLQTAWPWWLAGGALAAGGARVSVVHTPLEAVRGAHALYTDVWASMGQEEEQAERERAFAGWCLDEALLAEADARAVVLHCLPAHRGEEISAGVIEGSASRVFDQAENRLHAQQALLAALLGGL